MKNPSLSMFRAIFLVAIAASISICPSSRSQSSPPTEQDTNGPTPNLTSLVGKWYAAGDINKVCYLASAGDTFLAVNNLNTPYIVTAAPNNTIFLKPPDGNALAVKVLPNYLLGYGWWWTRTPTITGN